MICAPSVPSRVRPLSVLLALPLLLATLISCSDEAAQAAPPSMPLARVLVAPPEERELTDYEEFNGRVAAVEQVELRPRVSGYLEQVHFQAGAWVERDQLLFSIDARVFAADLARAEAALLRARTRLELSEREAQRYTELLGSGAVSDQEARQRSDERDLARAELRAAEAELALAQLNPEFAQVRAPIAGRISRALVTAGNYVDGSAGNATVLAMIVSVDPVYVYADISEPELLAFDQLLPPASARGPRGADLPVSMRLADQQEFRYQGVLESFDNRLDPNTGSLLVRARFANPDGLLVPGLYARLRLPSSRAYKALLVDETALGADQGQRFLWVLGPNNLPQYRQVELGAAVDGRRVIKSGLAPGELVIVRGTQFVRPGLPVEPERLPVPPQR